MINDDPPAHGIPLRAFRKVAIDAAEANATFPISDKAKIPRIIHQTLPTKALPPAIIENIASLNPGWEFRPYDDEGIVYFSKRHYAPAFLDYYQRVDPAYGAASADLFQYLLMYRCEAVNLDAKCTLTKPFDSNSRADYG